MADPVHRAHTAVLLVFLAFGAALGSLMGSLPVLVAQSGVSPAVFGMAGSLGMAANIFFMATGGLLNRIASHRTVLLVAIPAVTLTLALAFFAWSVVTFLVSFVVFNAALGALDLFMNAEAAAVERKRRKPSFGTYHGSLMIVMAVTALFGSLISVTAAPWFCMLMVAPLMLVSWIMIWRYIHDEEHEAAVPGVSAKGLPYKLLTIIGFAVGFDVAAEVAAIQWAGQLLALVAPEWAALSGIGLAFYGLCSGGVRLLGDGLRQRFDDRKILTFGIAIGICGFAVLGLSPNFWISALAFAAVGMGLAPVYPSLMSMIGHMLPHARAPAMSYVSLIGGIPRVSLPVVLGMVAANGSVSTVFSACALLTMVALVLIILAYARAGARMAVP